MSVSDRGLKGSPRKNSKAKEERPAEAIVAPGKEEKGQKGKEEEIERRGKTARAYEMGKLLAGKAREKKITRVVFDRGGYKYHGRVKAVAEGARDGGLRI